MNEAISVCRFLTVEGSYMRVSTVLGAIVLVLIILNEAVSACRLLKVEVSYMHVSTVLGAIVLVLIIPNEAVSACRFLKALNSGMIFYVGFSHCNSPTSFLRKYHNAQLL